MKRPRTPSPSSSAEAPPSSSVEARSLKTLTQGDKPYFITYIFASYNLSPSEIDEELGKTLKGPIRLKDVLFKPDRDIINILNSSQTLTQLTPSATNPGKRLTFNGMATVIGNLKYRQGVHRIDCSNLGPAPRNTRGIGSMTTDGALFILLVSKLSILVNLTNQSFLKRFQCIVITNEAPPDFLIMMEKELNLPVLALVDSDPESLKMLSLFGRRLQNIKWLGIRPTDMVGIKPPTDDCTLPMTDKDIETAKDLLLNDAYIKSRPQWLNELHVMLKMKLNVKIEKLFGLGVVSYLTEVFLPMKLQEEDWI